MARTIGIGRQDFEKIRRGNNFYVDKTDFIRQWWEAEDFIAANSLNFLSNLLKRYYGKK